MMAAWAGIRPLVTKADAKEKTQEEIDEEIVSYTHNILMTFREPFPD